MSCWNVSRWVAQLLELNCDMEIIQILSQYPFEQRRLIVSIQHQGSSLLFRAVNNRLSSILWFFLESCGADPNSFGFIQGRRLTCLALATDMNSDMLVKSLLYYGADTEIVFSLNEITAIFYACSIGRLNIAKLLIQYGANVNRRDSVGQTCLMASIYNHLKICKYLVTAGADINLSDNFGETCLTLALKNYRKKLVEFLLSLEATDVRLRTYFDIDVLFLAVQYSTEHVINRIIEKGSYTREEVGTVYELQSCLLHVDNFWYKSYTFWKKALELRGKPIETPMFQTPRRAGKLNEVIDLFNADNIPPLLFLESMSGLSLFTSYAYTLATKNVKQLEKRILLCKFFFKVIESLEDKYFFRALYQGALLLLNFFISDNINISHVLQVFDLLVMYTEEIYTRLERMTNQERMIHGINVDFFMHYLIQMFYQIHMKFPDRIYLLCSGITRIVSLDLRGLSQKSLLQMCAVRYEQLVRPFFIMCRADVNSSDSLGKTVLHDLVEIAHVSPDLISLIIDNGFDFHSVKNDEYCLPCRLQKRDLLPHPERHISLQCLDIRAFCENKMKSFSEIPPHFLTIINSHLYN